MPKARRTSPSAVCFVDTSSRRIPGSQPTDGAGLLGVFDIFRAWPGTLSKEELAEALTFAEVAMMTLLDGHDAAADGLAGAMAHRVRSVLYRTPCSRLR